MNTANKKTYVFLSLLLASAACDGDNARPGQHRPGQDPSVPHAGSETIPAKTAVTVDPTLRPFALSADGAITTDILVPPNRDSATGLDAQARVRDQAQQRSKTWAGYLFDQQSAAQRDRNAINPREFEVDILPAQVEDTGRENAKGERITELLTKVRMSIKVLIPEGRKLTRRVLNTFSRISRYDAWRNCHNAAGRAAQLAQQPIAFFCEEGNGIPAQAGEQQSVRDAEGNYQSSLVVIEFDQTAQTAQARR